MTKKEITPKILESFYKRVRRIAKPYVRPGIELDDLVQEAMIGVWQSLSKGINPTTNFIKLQMLYYITELRQDPVTHSKRLKL